MNLLLVLRALSFATASLCAILAFVVAPPLGGRLRSISRLAALATLGAHLGVEVENVFGRRAPWTKVLFPSIGIVALVQAFATDHIPVAAVVLSALCEACVLVFSAVIVVRAIRRAPETYPEDIVERELERFAPARLSRFMAAEMTIVVASLHYLFGGFRRPLPAGFSYVRTWSLVPLIVALPVLVLPEAVVLDFVLAHTTLAWGWRFANDALHIYGLLWGIGILATARIRPHRVDDRNVRLRFGALRKVDIDRANIGGVRLLGPVVDIKAFRRSFLSDRAAYGMVLDGAPAVEVSLRESIVVLGLLGGRRSVQRVVVSADDPRGFAAALT